MAQAPAQTKWHMTGNWIKNCNCNAGCPCDFNSPPSHGGCEGMAGMEITDGRFGDVPLTGLRWAITYRWPGALHEGHGTAQPFIDERATPEQREALLTIMSGQVGGTMFEIFAMILDTVLEPQFVPFEFAFDLEGRRARAKAGDGFETESTPISNPVTGEEHRIRVEMPEGFEYQLAEIAWARNMGTGAIAFDHTNSHSSLARVNFGN